MILTKHADVAVRFELSDARPQRRFVVFRALVPLTIVVLAMWACDPGTGRSNRFATNSSTITGRIVARDEIAQNGASLTLFNDNGVVTRRQLPNHGSFEIPITLDSRRHSVLSLLAVSSTEMCGLAAIEAFFGQPQSFSGDGRKIDTLNLHPGLYGSFGVARDGRPTATVSFAVMWRVRGKLFLAEVGCTGAGGEIRVGPLPAGKYLIRIFDDDFWWAERWFVLPSRERTQINLEESNSIVVQVLDSKTGLGVPQARIRVIEETPMESSGFVAFESSLWIGPRRIYANSAGRATIRGLPKSGRVSLVAEIDGLDTFLLSGKSTIDLGESKSAVIKLRSAPDYRGDWLNSK